MPTNDEIKKKYNIKKKQELLTLEDLERIIGTEGFNGLIKDWNNQISLFLDDLDKMLNEARIDTAKQIFADLFVIAGHLQANRYNERILKEMQALKKKYKVE